MTNLNDVEKIRNGDLYALLSNCSDDDLAPLAKCLVDQWTGLLDTEDDYKRHYPRHSKYTNLIANEIRQFGGNTLANAARGGGGPVYEEIVKDVCNMLDITPADNILSNEAKILGLYLDGRWKNKDLAKQKKEIEEAKRSAISQLKDPLKIVKQGGLLAIAAKAVGSIPAGMLQISEPAFTVTIPCVIHIAWLRQKFLASTDKYESNRLKTENFPVKKENDIKHGCSIMLTNDDDLPLLLFSPTEGLPSIEFMSIDHSSSDISRLNSLLQAAPSLGVASEASSGKYMEVIINGPLLKAKNAEGYRLITMIDGKPSHGTLIDPATLSNVANAAALLQIASVVVAQKHLADINKKLDELLSVANKIQDFQQNERKSDIEGTINYYQQIAPSVLSGERNDAIRNRLEENENHLLALQNHLKQDIQTEMEKIPLIKNSDMFGSEGLKNSISQHQRVIKNLIEQYFLCIRARACGWQLLLSFPGEKELKENRKIAIQKSLYFLSKDASLLSNFYSKMRDRIMAMSAISNKNSTVNERKLELLDSLDKASFEIEESWNSIVREFKEADAIVISQTSETRMFISIDDGKISGFCPVYQ